MKGDGKKASIMETEHYIILMGRLTKENGIVGLSTEKEFLARQAIGEDTKASLWMVGFMEKE